MTLREQLREATGREVEVMLESDLQRQIGIAGAKEWRAWLDRYSDQIDFREVLAGRAELGSFPLLLMSFQRGGLFLEFRQPNGILNRLRTHK